MHSLPQWLPWQPQLTTGNTYNYYCVCFDNSSGYEHHFVQIICTPYAWLPW